MKTTIKKVFCVLLAAALLSAAACLSSCSKSKPTSPTDASSAVSPTDDVTEDPANYEQLISLTADRTSAAPGESVTVTLHVQGYKNVACFDVRMITPDNAALTEYREKDVGELITTLTETGNDVIFSGIVATTTNIANSDMAAFTYVVSENAKSGDTVTVKAESSQFLIGTDESGDKTQDLTDTIEIAPLTIQVK